MEYVPGGTLRRLIQVNQRLKESEVRMIAAQLLLGLSYMHEQGYAHRDLKPDVSTRTVRTCHIRY